MNMKLLLHVCCGPCSCYPVKKLREDNIEPVGFFYNPNIHPYREWDMRRKTAREFAEKVNMEMNFFGGYELRDFLTKALDAEKNGQSRCRMCYELRLETAARFAAQNDFDAFTSTLFYSIHQNHEMMREAAERFAKEYGVDFYYEDFRIGWQEGIDISKELELYRQPYCGCIFSEEERFSRELRKERKRAAKERKALAENNEKDEEHL